MCNFYFKNAWKFISVSTHKKTESQTNINCSGSPVLVSTKYARLDSFACNIVPPMSWGQWNITLTEMKNAD